MVKLEADTHFRCTTCCVRETQRRILIHDAATHDKRRFKSMFCRLTLHLTCVVRLCVGQKGCTYHRYNLLLDFVERLRTLSNSLRG